MATEFVIDGDAGHDPERLPPVAVRIDGEIYQAHCPKDSIGLLYADFQEHADDASAQREITEQTLRMILAPEDAEAVMAKVLDMGNRRVGVSYVMDLAQKVMNHYESQLQERREEMGVAEPQNRAERRGAAKRAPAKKAAAKKTATKKPAPR